MSYSSLASMFVLGLMVVSSSAGDYQQTVTLWPGWNNVTLSVEPSTPYQAGDLVAAANSQGAGVTLAARLTPRGWSVYAAGLPFGNFTLDTAQGLLLYSARGGAFTLAGPLASHLSPALESPTPTPSPTSVPLVNAFHLPGNNEPPGVTMRNPYQPSAATTDLYFYLGVFPIGAATSVTHYIRRYGDANAAWTFSPMFHDSQHNNNDYYDLRFPFSGQAGEIWEYYFKVEASGVPTTFVYGEQDVSRTTDSESRARTGAFNFGVTQAGTLTPTPTASATPAPLNIWHFPKNFEPSAVTMRNPLRPDTNTSRVYLYLGTWPTGTVWTANAYYRARGDQNWSVAPFAFDSNESGNDYWLASFANGFPANQTVEYYIGATGLPGATRETFLYGDINGSVATTDEATAMAGAFTYENTVAPTLTPTLTPTQSPSETPVPTGTPTGTPIPLNVWHIPGNMEPPTVSMRNPLSPKAGDTVFLYLGMFPRNSGNTALLHYRTSTGQPFFTQPMTFDSSHGNNDYVVAHLDLFQPGPFTLEYYFEVQRPAPFSLTRYIHGDDSVSNSADLESIAQASPYSVIVTP